jgi:hypothetical protein
MPTLLDKKASELDELVAIVRDIQDKASEEDRSLTDVEKDRIAALSEAATKLRTECEFLNDQVVSERSWAKLRRDIEANKETEPTNNRRPTGLHPQQPGGSLDVRSWGDVFTESEAFLNYQGGGTSQRVAVPLGLEYRAPILSTTTPQAPYIYSPASYTYATPLLDKVGKVSTNGNAVQWVQWTPNPQAAASIVPEGELKPEAAMTATPQSGTLATYAHWKAISRQALEDSPQIRSLVENRLRQGIFVALEGAVNAALVAATLPAVSGSTMLGSIRTGIATVQAAGFATPNAILINPADAAAIDVAVMAGGMGGPVQVGSYWGIPYVPSSSVPVGTSYVGDFATGVQLFNRGTADVFMTDSHDDYFVRNLLLLLAETRALATVPDPAAIAECTVVTVP